MGRSYRAGLHAEMEGSVADPCNEKEDFGGWKLYVKELDSNTLPPFLTRLCDPDKQCSYSQEEVLCVFETAAEVHGSNIVPHVSQIVSAIIRIMSSGTGSLHSVGCSKVICTLSCYVIDPLGTEQEKSGIISFLCSPFSGCLMSTNESISSGSALCVTALIQSNNWQFASHELINDICLKVSEALEEVHCQTISHFGLVVALLKHNRLTLEPYGRSLIRSGLSILVASTKESNSQMITSSIQMIHSIMKNLDLSIISSEISSIIQYMEQLQDDSMSDINTLAFQAAETAKKLCRQEERGYGGRTSPLAKHGGRHSRKGSYSHSVMDDAEIRDSGSNESLLDDVQSAHRFRDHNSHPSVGQYSVVSGSARARRRLWSNGSDKSDRIPSDDFPHTVIPDYHDGVGVIAQSNSAGLLKSVRRSSDVSTRIVDPCPTCLTPQTTNRLSQVSRRGTFSEDVRMQSTPRKQLQFYNSCSDSKRDAHRLPASPAFRQIQRCSGQSTHGEVEERDGHWDSIQHQETVMAKQDERDVVRRTDISCLGEEILRLIAGHLAPSRRSIEAMSGVCRHWRYSVPPTHGPWLVLSSMDPGRPTVFLGIVGGAFVTQIPLFPPPKEAYCWNCSRGFMALSQAEGSGGFTLCVNSGRIDPLPPIPAHVRLTNLLETPQLRCAMSRDEIWWTSLHEEEEEEEEEEQQEQEHSWTAFSYGLGILPRSIQWSNGFACIASAPASLVIDKFFEERLLPIPDELEEVYYELDLPVPDHHPPAIIDFVAEVDPLLQTWGSRGQHVFALGGDIFMCSILRHSIDSHVEARLFRLNRDAFNNLPMLPANSIGNRSLFLGPNQALTTVAGPGLMPNTLYLVDEAPRVLAIDLFSGEQTVLNYPLDVEELKYYLPGCWLAPLPDQDNA